MDHKPIRWSKTALKRGYKNNVSVNKIGVIGTMPQFGYTQITFGVDSVFDDHTKSGFVQFTLQAVSVDITDLNNRLLPLLRRSDLSSVGGASKWPAYGVQECQEAFHHLLPLTESEHVFLDQLLE